MSTQSFYDPATKRIDAAWFDRPQAPKSDAPVIDVAGARRRVRSEPVATWEARVSKFTQRTEAAAANVRSLQEAFDASSQDVARGIEGAEERQSTLHKDLVAARGVQEKAAAALAVAVAQLKTSHEAERIVAADDYDKKQRQAHKAARAKARAALARHEAALAELRAADAELRATVVAAVSFEPARESWREPFNLEHVFRVCYAGDGVLPVVWPAALYDQIRAGFAAPDSTSPRAVIPSFATALSNHVEG
jgi:hypothetical protein